MEKSRTVSFEVLSAKAAPITGAQTEIVLAYKKADLAKRIVPALPAAKASVERQMKEHEKSDVFAVSAAYTEGGRSLYVIFEKGATPFKLHTELRKAIWELFACKDTLRIRLDLRQLDVTDARRLLESVAAVSAMAPFKSEVYGRKAKDVKALPALTVEVLAKLTPKDVKAISERGFSIGEANNLVRGLADLPPNFLNPAEYRKRVQTMGKALGAKVEYWDTKELKKKNAGAFLAVVQAYPETESGIAHLTFASKLKKPKKTIAFVGKGLCFDTGGYNVKTGDYMNGMHRDMTGSAIALATAALVAKLHPEFEVHAWLAIAENLISAIGYKCDDVVTASNGMSIEVVNTDAEGRMVLSDTLALASARKPDLMIDYATLTGAAFRALDTRRSAVFSNRMPLGNLAVRVGENCGERLWNFPIGEDYRDELKSKVADILQCCMGRNADHIYAATFLNEFVEKDVPWLHVDLCAAENKGGLGLVGTETTGFGVRWSLEFVETHLAK